MKDPTRLIGSPYPSMATRCPLATNQLNLTSRWPVPALAGTWLILALLGVAATELANRRMPPSIGRCP